MKKVEVNIKKLGPIENSTLKFSNLMIFSGDSGIGKSYASSLAHYLYVLLSSGERVAPFIKNDADISVLLKQMTTAKEEILLYSCSMDVLTKWINTDAINYIRYLIGNNELEGEVSFKLPNTDKIDFYVNQIIEGLKNQEEVSYELRCGSFSYSFTSNNPTEETLLRGLSALLIAKLNSLISEERIFFNDIFLMPPSRGALLDITNLTTLASESSEKILFRSGMYTEFLKKYEEIFSASTAKSATEKNNNKLDKILRKLNKGTIKQSNAGLSYEMEDGKTIPLSSAASSIKELAPLSLYLSKKPIGRTSSIWFEEPEAHLHPTKQVLIAELVGYIIQGGCHMQITTHSDYFLQRASNLILLYNLQKTDPDRAHNILEQFNIDNESLINPDDIKTYYLKQNDQGVTEIIDKNIEHGIQFDSFEEAINLDANLTGELLYK